MVYYIGKRKHLAKTIQQMRSYSTVTRKFAKVLSGEQATILLGYPSEMSAKIYGVNKRARIILTKKYALHMDNSGHFTGFGYGKTGHNDPNPLTMPQISNIPSIIKTATLRDVYTDKKVRGLQRYKIMKRDSGGQIVVIEICIEKNEIVLVTAYNLIKKRRPHNRGSLLSRG